MSVTDKNKDRVVVPAWYRSSEATSSEIRALNSSSSRKNLRGSLKEIYEDFQINPELGKAIEILNLAFTENENQIAVIAAEYVVKSGKNLPPALLGLAKLVLEGESEKLTETKKIEQQINEKKKWLRDYPTDSLSWVDLSRLYMSIGQIDAAKRAVCIGLNLSNRNRWVTRVATRFFYNIDDYDRAHHILLKHPGIKTDPWLLAAELAVTSGAGIASRHLNNAKRALEYGYEAYHVAELQSSIGSLELKSGAIKKAKKLFTESLTFPNGNVLAQAKWAEKKAKITELVSAKELDKQARAFEAKFLDSYLKQDMEMALEHGKKWIEEEPFNPEPAIQTSYIASLLDRYAEAVKISENGLKINSHDKTLQLNLIFSQVSLADMNYQEGDEDIFSTAYSRIEDMLKSDDKRIVAHALANLGLICYRQHRIEEGREAYEEAINRLKSLNHPSAVLAEINHLRESLIAVAPWREEMFKKVDNLASSGGFWDEPSVPFYLRKLNKIRKDPSNWRQRLTESDTFKSELTKNTEDEVNSEYKFDFNPKNPIIWLPRQRKN